ncbi:MAG: hypothetical protein JST04_16850 [Bdellovibrionales bacterium]|nr:hypothetical protein [Bdellovibrionales bacterium]
MKTFLAFVSLVSAAFSGCLQPAADRISRRTEEPVPSPSSVPPASVAPFACRAYPGEGNSQSRVDFGYPNAAGATTSAEGANRTFATSLRNVGDKIELTVRYRNAAAEAYQAFTWPNTFTQDELLTFGFGNNIVVGGSNPSYGEQWNIRCDHADLLPDSLPVPNATEAKVNF